MLLLVIEASRILQIMKNSTCADPAASYRVAGFCFCSNRFIFYKNSQENRSIFCLNMI